MTDFEAEIAAWRERLDHIEDILIMGKALQDAETIIHRLHAALVESEGRQKWLPIETAPKDGTRVDLFIDRSRWTDCYYNETRGSWVCALEELMMTRFVFTATLPTHWMPLPTPPAQERSDV